MKLKLSIDAQYTVTFLITVSLIVSTVTWVTLTPRPQEQFFALGILGSNKMAEHYYPNDNPNITLNTPVQWYLYLYNHMSEAQYIIIKVKLLNSTTPPPNSTSCTPSSQPAFTEIRRALTDNETLETQFTWSIKETQKEGGSTIIKELTVNDNPVTGINAYATSGINYRIIFELWTYNENTQQFEFGWRSGNERRCAWTQIWFNATIT